MMGQYLFDDSAEGFQGHFESFYANNFTGIGTSVTDLISGAFGGIGKLFKTLVGDIFLMLMLFPVSVVSYAFAIGFISPAFNLIVMGMTAKTLSKSFGEEVDITALTRLI
jgi:hypothetical protein